jgi:CBS domain-containing protein
MSKSIQIRVADFLKKYPPFQYFDSEQLVELSTKVKVRFHEQEELIFEEGKPRQAFFYVVQQGTVVLLKKTGDQAVFVDLRGEGDLLGMQGFLGSDPYVHTAKTRTETILYAIPSVVMLETLEKYPRAQRYLGSYFSLNPFYEFALFNGQGQKHVRSPHDWVDTLENMPHFMESFGHGVPENVSLLQAATLLQDEEKDALVLLNEKEIMSGVLTRESLCKAISSGVTHWEGPALEWADKQVATVSRQATISSLYLKMIRECRNRIVVTEDGSPTSRYLGIITQKHGMLLQGDFPNPILNEVLYGQNAELLPFLHSRFDAFVRRTIPDRTRFPWLLDILNLYHHRWFLRLLYNAIEQVDPEAVLNESDFSIVLLGASAREELSLYKGLRFIILLSDTVPESQRRRMRAIVDRMGQSICARHQSYREKKGKIRRYSRIHFLGAAFVAEWEQRYEGLLLDVNEQMAPGIDFRTIYGNPELAQQLSLHIRTFFPETKELQQFYLAEANALFPPVTVFQDSFIMEGGQTLETLDLDKQVIKPLSNLARILSLELNDWTSQTSCHRFHQGASFLTGISEAERKLLLEGFEAVRTTLYLKTLHELRYGARPLSPSLLTRDTRELLKSVLRDTHDLMEFCNRFFQLQDNDES